MTKLTLTTPDGEKYTESSAIFNENGLIFIVINTAVDKDQPNLCYTFDEMKEYINEEITEYGYENDDLEVFVCDSIDAPKFNWAFGEKYQEYTAVNPTNKVLVNKLPPLSPSFE